MEKITLNMTPSACLTTCHASQYDIGRQVRFDLVNGADAFVLSGAETVTLKIRRADGVLVENAVPNTSSNYVIWTSVAGECDAAGVSECELRVTDGDDVLGSANFLMSVEADAYDGRTQVKSASGAIATFETGLADALVSATVDIVATGGNGTPDNPNPINGYSSANIVNTQNESIVDLFSVDSDFRGTVAFNQLVGYFAGNAATTSNVGTNEYKATSTALRSYFGFNLKQTNSVNISTVVNNIYFVSFDIAEVNVANITGIEISGGFYKGTGTSTGKRAYILKSNNSANTLYMNATASATTTTDDNFTIKNVNVIDLTQMFGSTIADYIYGLEHATEGAGVAFFRSIYPADYYDYDSGTNELVGKETPEATIAFGQMVYGGVLDVTRGKLHVTHGYIELNSLDWDLHASFPNTFYTNGFTSIKLGTSDFLCTCYANGGTFSNYGLLEDGKMYSSTSLSRIAVKDTNYSTKAEFVSAMAGKYLAYELATPFDIDLTPEVISAVVGENNVFADCGDIAVEYLDLL